MQLIEFLSFFEKERNFYQYFQDFRFTFLINVNKAFLLDQRKPDKKLSTQEEIISSLSRAIKSINETKDNIVESSYSQMMEQIKL